MKTTTLTHAQFRRLDPVMDLGGFSGVTVRTTYRRLVELFGPPTRPEGDGGYKVFVEWALRVGRDVVTVYDWKERLDPSAYPSSTFDFHLGGRHDQALAVAKHIETSGE